MAHEIVVKGGTVVDGTGAPARRADVRVVDGVVAEIGPGLAGDRTLDASGAVVAPGFIDLHTHYDAQVFWDPWLTPSSLHGVTTVVAGNTGLSLAPCREALRDSMVRTLHFVEDMAPDSLHAGVDWSWESFPDYRKAVNHRGVGINFGNYVGHTAARLWVMGDEGYEREATDDEIRAMRAVVSEAIRQGAVGFSSDRSNFHKADGGRPAPSVTGSAAEVEALMTTAAEEGAVSSVIVDEDAAWLYNLQPRLGRPVTWCQIITYPDGSPRQPWPEEQLALHASGTAAGARVHPQVTCRPISFQVSFAQPMVFLPVPAFGELATLSVAERAERYRDPEWRRRAAADLGTKKWVDPSWDKFTVEESPRHPDLLGRTVSAIAAERGEDPLLCALDITLGDKMATRFRVVFANDDIALLERILTTPGCIMGLSDAGAHLSQMCDAPLPVDFLAYWVRDRELMPLEQGIRKVTGELAEFLGLSQRGKLEVGQAADLIAFDLDELDPGPLRRIVDFPADTDRLIADAPTGIRHVLVNGEPIRRDGHDVRETLRRLPGVLLSR